MAVFLALKHFHIDLRGRHVLVRMDNMLLVSYINHQSCLLYRLVQQILLWSQGKLLSFRAVYIPGQFNWRADALFSLIGAGLHGADMAEATSVRLFPDRTAPGSSGEIPPGRSLSPPGGMSLAGQTVVYRGGAASSSWVGNLQALSMDPSLLEFAPGMATPNQEKQNRALDTYLHRTSLWRKWEQLFVCDGPQRKCFLANKRTLTPSYIRLVGSGGDCAGRLEVFHSGSWGTVCDDSWGIEDADVVCRQLQCGRALSTHTPAWFGPGTGSIWLNEVECEGNETSLWNCRFQLCEEGECGHQEDVGVVCSEFKEIRLTEGCEGNLKVFYNGTWGNVCHTEMNDETVNMVCRELNCGKLNGSTSSRARVESAPNWLDYLKCRKHDSNMWQCPSSPWGQNRCDNSDEVAHITCTGGPQEHWSLRLSGGKGSCSGRLEVYHNATWGSVCDDQWNISNAQVVCRQLGCGSVLSADRFGPGEGTVWLNRVKCRGDEIHLWDCHHSLKKHTDFSHAGVTCADTPGSTPSEAPHTPQLVCVVNAALP
ncbi:antigen WC1.1-like [Silurus meridionalis]|uniref:antigen WC1.1-like n=1 Tax=Silurus meridionalis TaxID=175797 RepID=UPI001EE9D006|nr:antigen WC1.1-like [Silurus meridionalis]